MDEIAANSYIQQIADLQDALQQVQERVHELETCYLGETWRRLQAERDAAIERGVYACEVVQYLRMRWDVAREENRLQGRMMLAAERDAKGQRALAEARQTLTERLGSALDKTTQLIAGCPTCRKSDIFPLFPGALDVPPENTVAPAPAEALSGQEEDK